MDALQRACDALHGAASLARAIGVTPQFLSQVLSGARPLPAKRVIAIERATDGKVTRHELRPDLYPIDSGPHTSEAPAVPTPGEGYRPVGVPAEAPPPCDEAGREGVA